MAQTPSAEDASGARGKNKQSTIEKATSIGFAQGVAYAAAEIERSWGQTEMAMHLLRASGLLNAIGLRKSKVDAYDRKVCLSILRRQA